MVPLSVPSSLRVKLPICAMTISFTVLRGRDHRGLDGGDGAPGRPRRSREARSAAEDGSARSCCCARKPRAGDAEHGGEEDRAPPLRR
jgi:hypothetical protein